MNMDGKKKRQGKGDKRLTTKVAKGTKFKKEMRMDGVRWVRNRYSALAFEGSPMRSSTSAGRK